MTRIVEHRSALPFGTVIEVHVHRGPATDAPVLATIDVTKFNSRLDLESFVDPLPVADAFLRALVYAEQTGIACVWIDDPDRHFPLQKRPMNDIGAMLAQPLAAQTKAEVVITHVPGADLGGDRLVPGDPALKPHGLCSRRVNLVAVTDLGSA